MNKKLLFGASFAVMMIISCNSNTGKDSGKIAEKQNKERADTNKAAEIITDDSKFVVKATSGVTMEVDLGKYAEQNAASASVKSFGKMMSEDHGKDKIVLGKMATDKNITVPAEPGEDFKKHE